MPYLQRTTKAGKTIFVDKYYSSRYGKKSGSKAPTREESSEKQKLINDRRAQRELQLLLLANFVPKDLHLVLTYRKGQRPDPDEAKPRVSGFLRKVRKIYRANGKELKYVLFPPEHKTAAIHHHLVINAIDPALLVELWPYGSIRPSYLYEEGQFLGLAIYLLKEAARVDDSRDSGKKRYSTSRNLIRPKAKVKVIPADSWLDDPRPLKGYYIPADSIETDVDERGMPYQSYWMVKLE